MIEQVIGLLGAALSGGGIAWVSKALIERRRLAAKEAQAASDVQRSEVIRDERVQLATIHVEAAREERTEAQLWRRLEKVEEETRRCEQQREIDRAEHERQRQADREECERHTERRVSEAVECVTREMTRQLHSLLDIMRRSPSVTDSMSEEIEAVRRRSLTPPGEYRVELDVLTPHPEDDGA